MLGKLCCPKSPLCCNSHRASQPRATGDSCVTAPCSPAGCQSWLILPFCPTDLPLTVVGSQTGAAFPFLPRGFTHPPTAHGSRLSRHSTGALKDPGGCSSLSLPKTGLGPDSFGKGWFRPSTRHHSVTQHRACAPHPHTSTPSPPISPPRRSLLMDPVHKSEVSEPKETAGRWREGGKRKRLFEY